MEWLNGFGLAFVLAIMIPNIIFAIRCRDGFENVWKNKAAEIIEQIGRFGCMGFMVFNVPGTWLGWWADEAFAAYLAVDSVLIILYWAIWVICWKKQSLFKAWALSAIPSALFVFSAVMSRSALLGISALLFAPAHILISVRNAAGAK